MKWGRQDDVHGLLARIAETNEPALRLVARLGFHHAVRWPDPRELQTASGPIRIRVYYLGAGEIPPQP